MDRDEDYAAYVNARWAGLVRAAVLLGCSRPDAEDTVQATLVRCYVSWSKVQGATDRDAYVYRMLVNTLTTSRRRRWWAEQPTAEQPTAELPTATEPADEFDQADVTDGVRRALAQLAPESRAVVVLRYYADLTERQTADALGIAVGTVKSRMSRALAQLALDPHPVRSAGRHPVMTPEDDTRDLVRRAGDAVPVSPAPVHDLLKKGRGARRRRTVTTLGVVAASVAVITTGAVAVGAQLTDASNPAASKTTTTTASDPAAGTRFVGRNGIGLALPAGWSTNQAFCGGRLVVRSSDQETATCYPGMSFRGSRVVIMQYGPSFGSVAISPERLGTIVVNRTDPFSPTACTEFCPRWIGGLESGKRDVSIAIYSDRRSVVQRLLDSAFAIPDGSVAIPSPGSYKALRALGLDVALRLAYRPNLAGGTFLRSEPALGSVVARGSDVTVTITTHQRSPRCWLAPVEVVTPTTLTRPNMGYGFQVLTVHVGDHLTMRTIGPCGDDAAFEQPPNSVVTRTSGREVVAAHPGMVRIGVVRPGAAGIGDVTVHVRP